MKQNETTSKRHAAAAQFGQSGAGSATVAVHHVDHFVRQAALVVRHLHAAAIHPTSISLVNQSVARLTLAQTIHDEANLVGHGPVGDGAAFEGEGVDVAAARLERPDAGGAVGVARLHGRLDVVDDPLLHAPLD